MTWRSRKSSRPRKKAKKRQTPEQIEARNKKLDKAANGASAASDLAWGARIIAGGLNPAGVIIGGGMIIGRVLPMLKRKIPEEEEEKKKRKPRGSAGETV